MIDKDSTAFKIGEAAGTFLMFYIVIRLAIKGTKIVLKVLI